MISEKKKSFSNKDIEEEDRPFYVISRDTNHVGWPWMSEIRYHDGLAWLNKRTDEKGI